MASPPLRDELAGNPTNAEFKLGIGKLWDYVTSLLGNTSVVALDSEKKLARENLGVGSFGFKNRLINPEFLISQEFDSSSVTISSAGSIKYIVDGWYGIASGANISGQRIAGIGTRKYSLRLTGSSGNTASTLGQRIESLNCVDLKNQNIVVSFKSKAPSNKTITWTAFYANSENIFSSKTIIASGTLNITTTINDYNFSFNGGANAGNGIAIEYAVGALGSTETIDFDQIQIEKSNVATEFEIRSIQTHLALCQRYYEVGFYGYRGYDTGSATIVFNVNYKVAKRVVATLTGASGLPGASLNTIDAFSVQLTGTGVLDTGGVTWTASARL